MCFYVNLSELWPFRVLYSTGGSGESWPKTKNNDKLRKANETKAYGRKSTWWRSAGGQLVLAPHWLTDSDYDVERQKLDTKKKKNTKHPEHYGESGELLSAADGDQKQQPLRQHYGSDLVGLRVASGAGFIGLSPSSDLKKEWAQAGDFAFESDQSFIRHTGSHQAKMSADQAMNSNNNEQEQKQQEQQQELGLVFNNKQEQQQQPQQPQPQPQQQQQQQYRQGDDVSRSIGTLAQPSLEALKQAARFRIRTAHRRHLDFDAEFDLEDTQAPQRSRWSGPFHFIQAADCQFGMIDSYVHHRQEPGWREEIELCERLVELANRMQPRPLFMIICGDLVDSLPVASEIGRLQVVDFKRIFAKLSPQIPLVCVCGNHDVGDQPTPRTIQEYRQTFGEDYFYFTRNDLLFIVINSQFYQNRSEVAGEAQEQDVWLERLLAKCKLFKYSIIFEHIPWFLERPDEEDDYFNIRREVRLDWLRKFQAAGVTKIMCGHYHRNAGGWFEGMELVVTSAIGAQCGSDKSGIRIVRVLEHSIHHQYYAMDEVPLKIELGQ